MLPLLAVSRHVWLTGRVPISSSYMAGDCQNVCLWNFGHDFCKQTNELPLV